MSRVNNLIDMTSFWPLIGLINRSALQNGDESAALKELKEALSEDDDQALRCFENDLSSALYALDRADLYHASGDMGSDGFLYLRCSIVGMGQAYYEGVLAKALEPPKSLECWFEGLLSVSQEVWQSRHSPDEGWIAKTDYDYETGSNKEFWGES